MINLFLKHKTKKINNSTLSIESIRDSKKILFSIFTRYGDTIIDLVVIKEFIELYPNKEYIVLCPRQMKPYVNELLPDIKCIALNKRNLFDMLKVNYVLKKWQPDIGFNPWSNGLDSCYFLTYCKQYLCYKDFKRPKTINHYQVVRRYLDLPKKDWSTNELVLKDNYRQILICPQSTDSERSMTPLQIDELIVDLKQRYKDARLVIASMDSSFSREDIAQFTFEKSLSSSEEFIKLFKDSDLAICTDSAPLHIASALDKDLIAVFHITKPEIVINHNTTLLVS
ncbi:glycosyltransferase family 9 protein [Candidatus Woesearchaeota archaeon]|jgi:ADP-heptose:LPS heptosyltransferase|nr:glycosyltransferase family 9 protein [Candidatus Woesearchaeota archaeon]